MAEARSLSLVMDELFAPRRTVEAAVPELRSLRRLTTLIFVPIFFVVPAILVWVLADLWWVAVILLVIGGVIAGIRLGLIGRTWRSWGYVEREDDLYITHGVLFRSLVAVPYGRMQLVEVESGPWSARSDWPRSR